MAKQHKHSYHKDHHHHHHSNHKSKYYRDSPHRYHPKKSHKKSHKKSPKKSHRHESDRHESRRYESDRHESHQKRSKTDAKIEVKEEIREESTPIQISSSKNPQSPNDHLNNLKDPNVSSTKTLPGISDLSNLPNLKEEPKKLSPPPIKQEIIFLKEEILPVKEEIYPEYTRIGWKIERNLFTIKSFFYKNSKGIRRRIKDAKFKEIEEELKAKDPIVEKEEEEVKKGWGWERKRRYQKLADKLEHGTSTAIEIESEITNFKGREVAIIGGGVEEVPFLPWLYGKIKWKNENLNNIEEKIRISYEKEDKIMQEIWETEGLMRNINDEISVLDFKFKINETKINSHNVAISSLKK